MITITGLKHNARGKKTEEKKTEKEKTETKERQKTLTQHCASDGLKMHRDLQAAAVVSTIKMSCSKRIRGVPRTNHKGLSRNKRIIMCPPEIMTDVSTRNTQSSRAGLVTAENAQSFSSQWQITKPTNKVISKQ